VPTITFTVDDDGNINLELKGPKSIHALRGDFDRDLKELTGDTKSVEKSDLTEKEPLRNTPQRQAQKQ
jgi:hypothetical protein